MKWKELSLDEKKIFDEYISKSDFKIESGEFLFTNLYMWKESRITEYSIINDFLCLRIKYNNRSYFYTFPIGSGDVKFVIENLINENDEFRMRLVGEEQRELIDSLDYNFEIKELRDKFDYIYNAKDLRELKGKRYHKKKNLYNSFIKKYSYSYEILSSDNVKDFLEAEEKWCEIRECDIYEGLRDERSGIIRILKNYESLNLLGLLLKVDSEVVGFTIGERISDDYLLIHVEKALGQYTGSYQAINRIFLENQDSDIKFVNREEDLGIEGLRKMKKSYNPIKLLEKYDIRLIK